MTTIMLPIDGYHKRRGAFYPHSRRKLILMPHKKIIVPTDFSPNADKAISYAMQLAKKEKSRLIILHAFNTEYPESEIPVAKVVDVISETQKNAETKLKEISKRIFKKNKVKCDFKCKEGSALDVILEESDKHKPDFIVMGTKGASGLKEIILGSNTSKVIERSNFPVIAVPGDAVYKDIKQILFSTNYYESDITAMKRLVEIAKIFKSRIYVLHVADKELTKTAEKGLMQDFINNVEGEIKYEKITYQIKYGTLPEKVLQDHIKKEKPDLIAMSTHRRNLLERFFGMSITKQMAYHTSVPLLAFHGNGK